MTPRVKRSVEGNLSQISGHKPPKKPHVYIVLVETRRQLKSVAARMGVSVCSIAEDALADLVRDALEVPLNVTGEAARAYLRSLRRRPRK